MIRNLLSYATLASLAACSQGESDTAADTEASTPAAVGGEAVTAYEPFFDQRWPQGVPVTPEEVSAILDEQGAQAIEAMATAPAPNRWNTVLRGIASGEPGWLAIAPTIMAGADGGNGEEVSMALTDALTTNPEAALALIAAQPDGGAGYCADPGYETPAEQVRAFYAAARASVESVTDPELQPAKAACLAELRSSEAAATANAD